MLIQFKLKGPLQSWGTKKINGGDYFPTDDKPTKSGIIGLIACVMGIERGDPQIRELSDSLKVYVRSYPNDGIMTDYHIIEASMKRRQYLANGTKGDKGQATSIVTRRSYIQNGEFDVIVEGEKPLLEKIIEAFDDPHWTPYLGRKCCSVSEPIIPEWISDMPDAEIVR